MVPKYHDPHKKSFESVEHQIRDAWNWCLFLRVLDDAQAEIAIDDAAFHLENALDEIRTAMRRLGYRD